MIERHRAAIRRTTLSRPLRLARDAGVLGVGASVFDLGCGHGDDLRFLANLGHECAGWDPYHRPSAPKHPADVCYLGFVLNVIERTDERAETLREAWSLAREALLVSTLVTVDAREGRSAVPFGDGVVTTINTFQKYFDQKELENFLRQETGAEPIALGMGVFVLARDEALHGRLLARRMVARSRSVSAESLRALLDQRRAELAPLLEFHLQRGRWPVDEECDPFVEWAAPFGGLGRAQRLLERVETVAIQGARDERRDDLLLLLALARLGSTKVETLPTDLCRDIAGVFGSLSRGRAAGEQALFEIGDVVRLRRAALLAPVGKRMPEALYLHRSAVDSLPRVLRLYHAAALRFVGGDEGAALVKLHLDRPAVSFLSYPTFDNDAHPSIAWSLVVDLRTFRLHYQDYRSSPNPPIVHRKELFVGTEYPHRARFERLTTHEEQWELYDGSTGAIGNRLHWQRRLDVAGVEIRGHRLYRSKR